LFALIYFNLIQ